MDRDLICCERMDDLLLWDPHLLRWTISAMHMASFPSLRYCPWCGSLLPTATELAMRETVNGF